MSKLLLVCFRDRENNQINKISPQFLEYLSSSIIPDNINPNKPSITKSPGLVLSILNPVLSCPCNELSAALGVFLKPYGGWWKVKGPVPDGSFAIFRTNDDYVELLTDCTASRTIWYIKTESVFIASSSQRAILRVIGGFQPNKQSHIWMLSSGCIGPGFSWDKRIKQLEPDSILLFDRNRWEYSIQTHPIEFKNEMYDLEEGKKILRDEITKVFDNIEFDISRWVLPLSGGYDSRAILMFLKRKPFCVTWGKKNAIYEKQNDAEVAKKVAAHFKVDHEYLFLDIDKHTIAEDIDRFIIAGEGRIDHIAGYVDGLKIWKQLFEKGFYGAIRGDKAFWPYKVNSEKHSRQMNGMLLYSDYENLKRLIKKYEFSPIEREQEIPKHLLRRTDESLITWNDRIYHSFRYLYFYSALNEVKGNYLESFSPLVTRNLVYLMRLMNDELRKEKKVYKEVVDELGPQIPYAKYNAIDTISNIIRNEVIVNKLFINYKESKGKQCFPDKLLDEVLGYLDFDRVGLVAKKDIVVANFFNKIRYIFPNNQTANNIGFYRLAFRIYIIIKMQEILIDDSHKAIL